MKTLVTGGTGFLGAHLVRQLRERGEAVRVLSRSDAPELSSLGAEVLLADVVQDVAGAVPLKDALTDCNTLYHLAGYVSRDPADGQRMMRVHLDGTRRLFTLAAEAGIRRIVLASSSGTIAVSRTATPILDETAPYPTALVSNWPYYLSKIYQEKLAFDLAATLKLDLVVVNPSLLLGPGDWRNSSTGDVQRFLRREIPTIPSGGVSFVDARDAATATISAMHRGKSGERYLLTAANWSCAEFFGRLERVAKIRGPRLRLPDGLAKHATRFLEYAYEAVDRRAPIDSISVEMSQHFWYCDATKAKRELEFEPRDPIETLDETVRDLKRRMI